MDAELEAQALATRDAMKKKSLELTNLNSRLANAVPALGNAIADDDAGTVSLILQQWKDKV
jgi:hypothetical protein